MKFLHIAFLMLTGTLSGLVAHADQPENDPAVQQMRSNFQQARAPQLEDLLPGRSWDCHYLSAVAGSHAKASFPGVYRFSLDPSGTVQNAEDFLSRGYTFGPTSLSGLRVNGTVVFGQDHLRVGDHGELYSEMSQPACAGFACLFRLVRAGGIENGWQMLVGYSECQVEP